MSGEIANSGDQGNSLGELLAGQILSVVAVMSDGPACAASKDMPRPMTMRVKRRFSCAQIGGFGPVVKSG